jgi:hypothetical protein
MQRHLKFKPLPFAALCIALFLSSAFLSCWASAQTVSPVIVEATEKISGKFELTNDTLTPMAVVLEPKSFDLGPGGLGLFRPLDAGIHLELSNTSFILQPKESYYVFYKASADKIPAWFTVYAVFESIQKSPGLKVRIMLPHTVYLYQKKPLGRDAIQVTQAVYDKQRDKIVCDLENTSQSLIRTQSVSATGKRELITSGGFPLLPNSPRHLEIDWKQKTPPDYVLLHFPHFDVKEPLSVQNK